MKLSTLSIISSSLLLSVVNAQSTPKTLERTYNEDSFKNLAFFAAFGGSSHYNWVLTVMDELGLRGHNTTFITNVRIYSMYYKSLFFSNLDILSL